MKICFVGPANSAHIVKWCDWFSKKGHDVHVISFTAGAINSAKVHLIDLGVDADGSDFRKLKYLTAGRQIKTLVNRIKPDIVNAHYATSYGIALALSGINDYVLSVWGADIYDFPKKSFLHKVLLKYSLKKATHLFSTSQAMAIEASKYTDKKFEITPFGVDMNLFNPNKRTKENTGTFIVGTVKGLEDKYGIEDIIHAVDIIRTAGSIHIKARIAGRGTQEETYRRTAKELGLENIITWLSFISQEQAAVEWANMDVAIIPSTLESESFGVSALEAQACGTPVIISDIPGLMETTCPDVTSIVVRRRNPREIANVIEYLYMNESVRDNMGSKGRAYVRENYEINNCFEHIEELFQNYLEEMTSEKNVES